MIRRDCMLSLQCDHCNENHLDTDEDSSNSDEDADDGGNRRDADDAVECHDTRDLRDVTGASDSSLRPALRNSSAPAVANLMTLNTSASEAVASGAVTNTAAAAAVAGASVANGNLFVFGEHSDAQVFLYFTCSTEICFNFNLCYFSLYLKCMMIYVNLNSLRVFACSFQRDCFE